MEQFFIIPINTTVTNQWGSMYITGKVSGKYYPNEFIDTPIALLSIVGYNDDAAWLMIAGFDSNSNTTVPIFYICRGEILERSIELKVQVHAIGRWK